MHQGSEEEFLEYLFLVFQRLTLPLLCSSQSRYGYLGIILVEMSEELASSLTHSMTDAVWMEFLKPFEGNPL